MVAWRLCSLAVCAATMLLSAQVSADSSRRFGAQSSAVVTIKKDSSSFFGTNAYDKGWGAKLKDQTRNKNGDLEFFQLVYTTASLTDPFGCTAPEVLKNASSSKGTTFTVPSSGSFILLVDRGHCSFTEKALHAQQLGAVGVIITDTQQQAYNRTLAKGADEISRAMEYSCANGRGEVPDKVDMTDFASNPEKWAEDVNVKRCTTNSFCESNLCIPTGKGRQVCCLWDIAEQMDFSNVTGAENPEDITIAVVRLKIADGMELKPMLANTTESLQLVINDRHTPRMDPSSFIIWLLAIITVMTGGYKGATIERQRAQRKQSAAALLLQNRERGAGTVTENRNGGEFSPRTHAAPPSLMNESIRTGTTAVDHSAALEEELLEDDDTMDLNVYHAIFFVVFATVFLLILFYWNVVIVVIVLFAIGSVSCTFYILWQPLYHKLSFLHHRPFKTVTAGFWAKFEPDRWSVADMLAVVTALFMAVLWFLNRNRHYAWILQDTFGVCLSILFLRTIRLPNLKIATCMLVLVFLYDIFMVFISPYIFKKSVMISVATGGSQAAPTVSSGYCLRYPQDTAHHCLKEQIPILLRFPKVIDWRDGQSMLGLGDIVLPGLLIVFCARFDYATRGQLLGRVKAPHLARLKAANNPSETVLDDDQQNQQNQLYHNQQMPELTTHGVPDASRRGLFGILMWGYAIGLLGANIGVMLMKQGQPALMYLVPTTLGTLVIVAWRRGILRKLWDGPEEFKMRDPSPHHHHARSMTQGTLRDRGFTVDHVMDTPGEDIHDIVVVDGHSEATPHSTYARPEDTPRRQTLV